MWNENILKPNFYVQFVQFYEEESPGNIINSKVQNLVIRVAAAYTYLHYCFLFLKFFFFLLTLFLKFTQLQN
jgi:hypothetical protein